MNELKIKKIERLTEMFNFKSTENAMRFGRNATVEDARNLRLYRSVHTANCQRLIKDDLFNAAMVEATKAQFCREALEAHNEEMQMLKEVIEDFEKIVTRMCYTEKDIDDVNEVLATLNSELTLYNEEIS